MNRTAALLMALFVSLNLMAPIASNKVVDLGFIIFTAGSLLIAISYGALDILNDWKGRRAARVTVETALIVRAAFFLVIVPLLIFLPAKSVTPGFDAFLATSARLFVAGWFSLLVGGWFVNTPIFSWLRVKMHGRNFILRYLATSFPTIIAGNVVYITLGFYGTPVDIPALILGTTVARVVLGVIITPFVALGRYGVRQFGNQNI